MNSENKKNSNDLEESEESGKARKRIALNLSRAQIPQWAKSAGETSLIAAAAFGIASLLVISTDFLTAKNSAFNSPSLGYANAGNSIGISTGIGNHRGSKRAFNHDSNDSPLTGLVNSSKQTIHHCAVKTVELEEADLAVARIAWAYFEKNYNSETGLVNSVDGYPSTTMWDTGSALAAFVAAKEFGFIDQKFFDDAMMKLIKSLNTMELFEGKAPNKVYHTKTLDMVDYGNNPVEGGIGISVLDLARLISWMNTLQCMHPKYSNPASVALSRWDYSDLISNQEMYGMARDPLTGKIQILQEGRLGYEQYAGKIFDRAGFPVDTSKSYENQHRADTDILGVSIGYDSRDPRIYHANNYVVTESYAMDAMELGIDGENKPLLEKIFEVQKKRWTETGIVTAISEDNINQEPWFLYNTIFNAGISFNTTTDTGVQYDNLKSVSTKAAISMALLYPDDEYSAVLLSAVESAYDPKSGWYSGVYERGGYNDVATANTNGVILSGLLYKKYGTIYELCEKCAEPLNIESSVKRVAEESSAEIATTLCESCEKTR